MRVFDRTLSREGSRRTSFVRGGTRRRAKAYRIFFAQLRGPSMMAADRPLCDQPQFAPAKRAGWQSGLHSGVATTGSPSAATRATISTAPLVLRRRWVTDSCAGASGRAPLWDWDWDARSAYSTGLKLSDATLPRHRYRKRAEMRY